MTRPNLHDLREELAALRATVDHQAAELDALRQERRDEPVSRRHLLRGLAGLGAAGAVGIAAADAAAAADGDNLILGTTNTASSRTLLVSSDEGLEVEAPDGEAIVGRGRFMGVSGTSDFFGVSGRSEIGVGWLEERDPRVGRRSPARP